MSKEKVIKHIKTIKSYINCLHSDLLENINSRGYVEIYDGTYIFKDIFKDYTFIDKTPFGIKE